MFRSRLHLDTGYKAAEEKTALKLASLYCVTLVGVCREACASPIPFPGIWVAPAGLLLVKRLWEDNGFASEIKCLWLLSGTLSYSPSEGSHARAVLWQDSGQGPEGVPLITANEEVGL